MLLTGIQMKSTLFCLTCHVEPEGDSFTIFEKEKTSLARHVEVVFDINNRKVVLFESEADIETVALKAVFANLLPLLPQVQALAKKFLKNYLAERLQASSHN